MNLIDDLKDVFELATNATTFVNELLKIKNTKNKLKQNNNRNSERLASSRGHVQLVSSGNFTQLASSGNGAQLATSGNCTQLASSGDCSRLATSGNCARLASSGNSTRLASSGEYAQLASSGNGAQLANLGNYAQLVSSGDYAQLASTGKKSVIAAVGYQNIARAKIGSWITLAEYKKDNKNNLTVSFVKTEYVDGENIKEDTYYILKDKQFKECVYIDGIISIVLKKHKNILKVKNIGEDFESYIVKEGDIYSHGRTIKEAKDSLLYKISNHDTSQYENYNLNTEISLKDAISMYRVITGACESGTKYFVEQVLTDKKDKYTVQEVIKLTTGQYNHDKLVEFFERK